MSPLRALLRYLTAPAPEPPSTRSVDCATAVDDWLEHISTEVWHCRAGRGKR